MVLILKLSISNVIDQLIVTLTVVSYNYAFPEFKLFILPICLSIVAYIHQTFIVVHFGPAEKPLEV